MERRVIAVRGTVQGVGFRPFIFGLASRLRLGGYIQNDPAGVRIEVEGERGRINQFLAAIAAHPPALAQIDEIRWDLCPPSGQRGFEIRDSEIAGTAQVVISADVGVCEQCLVELFDPSDRRYRHPFINCTNCGPRLTIATGAPYDRRRTTMASFAMCEQCRAEYENPADRRFHAQPIACPDCGPRLQLLDACGTALGGDDPLRDFSAALAQGRIGALKGLGGFHLVCDARLSAVVKELRRRKHRDEKPLAIMVRDFESARRLCDIEPVEADLLVSRQRPIVLLRKRGGIPIAREVAPSNPRLGVMLPYTPLHYLLLDELEDAPLVMTSGNRSDEPIAIDDADAVRRLSGIADMFLVHNRPIHVRCDDSVTQVIGGGASPIRRSRGYAPRPLRLPQPCPAPMIALGGHMKGTFALGRDRQAIPSQHLGDLDDYSAYRAFERDVDLYQKLFRITPQYLVHDLHPDYATTRYAMRWAEANRSKCIAVQHHHAHMASCMAEHQLAGPAIGVTFDGTGLGTDDAVWGGEFLLGGYKGYQRAAQFRYVRMPGGEHAIRQPWRMAAAHLIDADCDWDLLADRIPARQLQAIERMTARALNAPFTSSVGRLFDAVAALVTRRDRVNFEGQAAMELEWLVAKCALAEPYPFAFENRDSGSERSSPLIVDTRPLIAAVASDVANQVEAARIAGRFHATLIEIVVAVCRRLRESSGVDRVVLSGGAFMNSILATGSATRLSDSGFQVYRHRLVPPNDGGLSLGQLAIAAAQLASAAKDMGN